ncbi:hypothetical protein [Sulfitobacter pontiacus]|uniref:hypothetical protein n=1 Tax=Sulfitobacter pontiacus TaxID=60137 RepID=UPI0030EC3F15
MTSTTTAQRSDAPEETIATPFLTAGLNLFGEDGSVRTASYAKALAKYAASNVVEIADYQDGSSREVLAAEPEYLPSLNDAEILGTEPEGFAEFLGREATLLVGEMWGARDRRNTLDGDWKSPTMTWGQWIGGGAGSGNAPAWGFSRHPESKNKAGPCIVLGSSVDGARKAKAMTTMAAAGLDVDSGAKLDDVLETIEELGLLCIVYTSYNNGTSGLELKRDEVLRKLKITRDPTEGEIRQYLREFDKNRYEESFIAGCSISVQKKQTSEGVKIILDTPPLEKFRLIFPFEEPVNLIDLADTQQASLDLWEDKITGLAQNTLGIHFDTSCSDPSRLFYTARHPKGSEDWYAAVVMGTPLKFDDVKPMKKSVYTSNREVNAFTMAADMSGDERPPMALTPSGKSLNDWHRTAKERFLLADLMETLCPDRVRNAGGEAQGHVHTECPFEHEHSSEGGTATMAVNAVDSQSEYWTWFCHHDACQGRHKLQHLEEALRQGWFEEDALTEDAGFLLEGDDDSIEELTIDQRKKHAKVAADDATQINQDSTQEEIENFFRLQIKAGADLTTRNNLVAQIAKQTNYTKPEVKNLWVGVAEETKEVKVSDAAIVNEWDFTDQVDYAQKALHVANEETPRLFYNVFDLVTIRIGSDGRAGLHKVDVNGLAHILNTVAPFVRTTENNSVGVSAPKDVVSHLYAGDYCDYPVIRGIVTTPSFTAEGTLLERTGYHADSELYYKPDDRIQVAEISPEPSAEEVEEAKRLLIQEILADFPLGGMSRAEILRAVLCAEEDSEGNLVHIEGAQPTAAPDVCHALVMGLFPFVREMIDGNAPGLAIDKLKPGTGAGKLEAAMSIIYAGHATSAIALPGNPEDMTKVLLPAVRSGRPNVFFDNISSAMDSGELASVMTARYYEARILGKSETALVQVRNQWIVAGNKLKLSPELSRRFVLTYLDPKTASPEDRTGFRHAEIETWVTENRGQLIWACLTLIQHWVAGGRQPGAVSKASYGAWSRVMGGILESAGFVGFLGNESDMKARSAISDDPLTLLLERLFTYPAGTLFVTGAVSKRLPSGTVSVRSILEDFFEEEDDPAARCLRLPGWGYENDGTYTIPQKLAAGWTRDVGGEPHRVGDVQMSFEVETHSSSGVKLWRLSK